MSQVGGTCGRATIGPWCALVAWLHLRAPPCDVGARRRDAPLGARCRPGGAQSVAIRWSDRERAAFACFYGERVMSARCAE